ncbi:MAG TPA: tRNA (adenosine(37)-N6)-threonylcarbamoyltransferase complex ATPase subunit type 1 TsaE [Tepidisphaeraceae bacterium]|nr:tRNA (adenosine(37)-N6)-threonylcarbamoyltransferase complex ATPase subunit type 1 TsaE [Tepidisphaeraceae bacterium]
MTVISHNVEQTQAIAAKFAGSLSAGQCIALHGELGAGKTQFVRGLLQGLGGDGRSVTSPTYMLLNVYDSGRLTLFHLDAYRVGGAEDFEAIGFSELLEQAGVVVVEWASRVAELLPADHINIHIEPVGVQDRQITIEGAYK